jgi:hypothetical protein
MAFSYDHTRTTAALLRMGASSNKTTLTTNMNTAGDAIATACSNASPGIQTPGYLRCEDEFVKLLEHIADELNDQL